MQRWPSLLFPFLLLHVFSRYILKLFIAKLIRIRSCFAAREILSKTVSFKDHYGMCRGMEKLKKNCCDIDDPMDWTVTNTECLSHYIRVVWYMSH